MKTKQAFTLTEVLVAATITMLVLAMMCSLLLNMLGAWHTDSTTLELSLQSRLLRERLLHGIQGQFGLR